MYANNTNMHASSITGYLETKDGSGEGGISEWKKGKICKQTNKAYQIFIQWRKGYWLFKQIINSVVYLVIYKAICYCHFKRKIVKYLTSQRPEQETLFKIEKKYLWTVGEHNRETKSE